jgi:UDP-glucose 4-epimerase
MRRILITGAAGFLGSHLCDALLARRWEVVGLDDLSHGDKRNLAEAGKQSRFRFFEADVRDDRALAQAAEGATDVAHLAAYKIPRYGNRLNTLTVNAAGTLNALEAARRAGARFLFASTSDCYGKNPAVPFSESHDSIFGPARIARWAYAVSKTYGEHLCFGFREEYGLKATVIRVFGSYGPRQHLSWWGGPQAVFAEQALVGKPLTIHGDGSQTRSFTFVRDTIAGFVTILESPVERVDGELFNVGSDEEISIADLARIIWRMLRPDEPERIEFIPYEKIADRPYEDVLRRAPDASRLRRLGWTPNYDLKTGLRETLDWQRALVREEVR